MPRRPSRATAWALAAVLLAAVVWGFNATSTKLLYAPDAPVHFDPIALVAARAAWSFPLLFGLAIFARPRNLHFTREHAWLMGVAAVCYGPGLTGLYAIAVAKTSALHAALFFGLSPPLAALLGAVFLRERITALKAAGLGLGVAGALLLAFGRADQHAGLRGDLLLMLWGVFFGSQAIAVRILSRFYPTLFITGIAGSGGALLLVAMCLAAGRFDALTLPLTLDPWTIVNFHLEMVLGLSFVAPMLQMYAIGSLDVALMSTLGLYGTTLVGLLAAVLILHERLAPVTIVAALMLLSALGASVWRSRTEAIVLAAETI